MQVITYPKNPFAQEAKRLAKKTGFRLGALLYTARHYGRQYRNAIYTGTFRGKPAVLKLYDEPQPTDEPRALAAFHRSKRGRTLRAPKLYASGIVSPTRGWLIMENLSGAGHFMHSPLSPVEREEFLRVFVAYRKSFPTKPHRPLTLLEQLPAHEYHTVRISRWLQLAVDTEISRPLRQQALTGKEFAPLYEAALVFIRQEFKNRKMLWCHGHVKPKEIFRCADGTYALTNFAHTRMYPEGYELAFIIWADWMLPGNWRLPYTQWKQPIREWLKLIRPVARQLGYKRVDALLHASMVERTLGAILADVEALDLPYPERRGRLKHLFRLLRELLNNSAF
ncbi:MAG: hypothetical protein AAB445_03140 [Patescibacteria group bacterium]